MTAPAATAPTAVADRVASVGSAPWLWSVAGATAVGAGVELVALRVFTRTIIHIPGASAMSPVLSVVAEIGRFAYYLSCVLLAATLVLVLVAAAKTACSRTLAGTAVLVTFGTAAIGARFGIVGDGTTSAATLAAAVALGVVAVGVVEPRARLPVAVFAGAFALAAFDALVSGGVVTVGRGGALRLVSEVLVVSAAVMSPLLLSARPDRRSVTVGVVAGVVVVAMLTANSWTTTILMLWNFGLAGTLPWVLYGTAFGALACALVALIRSGDRQRVIVVALLFAGGIGLHSTYQSGLVIAGLALLGLGGARRAAVDASHLGVSALPASG